MGKNIVILNGSPRLNGNTATLVAAFSEGAEVAGHTVCRFDLCTMNVKPCIGCCGGGKDLNHPCTQRDDMEQIYPAILEADVVVWASPMYYWNVSAQLKIAIDRMFALAEGTPDFAHPVKDAVFLMCAGSAGEENFAPARAYYNSLVQNLGWRNAGIVYAGGNNAKGDILTRPEQLEEARNLGAAL